MQVGTDRGSEYGSDHGMEQDVRGNEAVNSDQEFDDRDKEQAAFGGGGS